MARAERETRKRTRVCPECGEHFSPQGLNGHLRFKHGLEGEAVKEQTEVATVTVAEGIRDRTDATVGLIDRLKGIRREIAKIAESPVQEGLFHSEPDEAMQDCLAALEERELEIRNEIRKLTGKPPLKRGTRPVWGGLLGSEEALVPEDEGETLDA